MIGCFDDRKRVRGVGEDVVRDLRWGLRMDDIGMLGF